VTGGRTKLVEADSESSIDGCGSGWLAAALLRLEGTPLGIVELVEDNDMERGREVPVWVRETKVTTNKIIRSGRLSPPLP
jgi:hypothetical protein